MKRESCKQKKQIVLMNQAVCGRLQYISFITLFFFRNVILSYDNYELIVKEAIRDKRIEVVLWTPPKYGHIFLYTNMLLLYERTR